MDDEIAEAQARYQEAEAKFLQALRHMEWAKEEADRTNAEAARLLQEYETLKKSAEAGE